MSLKRKVGEEMILEKINKIFDEVAKDRDQFETSYQETSPKKRRDDKTQIEASASLIQDQFLQSQSLGKKSDVNPKATQ